MCRKVIKKHTNIFMEFLRIFFKIHLDVSNEQTDRDTKMQSVNRKITKVKQNS